MALALLPKCGLCVAAWALALVGLGGEVCGAAPSWHWLLASATRRPLPFLVSALPWLALASVTGWWLLRRLSTPTR